MSDNNVYLAVVDPGGRELAIAELDTGHCYWCCPDDAVRSEIVARTAALGGGWVIVFDLREPQETSMLEVSSDGAYRIFPLPEGQEDGTREWAGQRRARPDLPWPGGEPPEVQDLRRARWTWPAPVLGRVAVGPGSVVPPETIATFASAVKVLLGAGTAVAALKAVVDLCKNKSETEREKIRQDAETYRERIRQDAETYREQLRQGAETRRELIRRLEAATGLPVTDTEEELPGSPD
ncbi:hypothetical protein [Streptomyces sp. NPDC003720]|uniref:hypothetical protein n=1 Tax=Streptomyces sp. NPDC003720 TaxID=3364684 RepID=UPI0036802BC2